MKFEFEKTILSAYRVAVKCIPTTHLHLLTLLAWLLIVMSLWRNHFLREECVSEFSEENAFY